MSTGIYIVTLNNEEAISCNAHDKRIAHKAIKVNKKNIKVGRAKDLESRKKYYHLPFGRQNVNFQIIRTFPTFEETCFFEKQIMNRLENYRIVSPAGRKNEWLGGPNCEAKRYINSHEVKKIINETLSTN